ncbi:hypothetical protein D3C78_1632700 [compost metagenome]
MRGGHDHHWRHPARRKQAHRYRQCFADCALSLHPLDEAGYLLAKRLQYAQRRVNLTSERSVQPRQGSIEVDQRTCK